MRQKVVKAKEQIAYNEKGRIFFLISLRTCSKSLNDVNSLPCFV